MSEWIIEVNDGEEVLGRDDGLYDVIVSDTFNPFGNFAKGFFDDLEGQLFDLFQRGTKVSFQYSNDNTSGFTQRFVGYVVNDLEQEADGAEQLEIEAHTFDQFLRGSEVSNDQAGNTIFEALEDVIKTDVPPVSWDGSLVEVVDNVELTQSFQGETVEEFLLAIRQKSAGEVFTVSENLEFVFEPAEISRTRRDIDNSQWVTHDIGEEGSETRNQVTVVYNDGENAVTVDDSSDQLEIQDNLGAPGPGQEGTKISRPKLTNFEDAIDVGEQALQDRESTLTGPVTTFDLNSAEPGDVIGITINPRGIDTDFRIAENRMQWRSETNELTVIAKKGADDDILIQQSKTLKRVENRVQDLDIVPDRVTDTKATAFLDVSATDGAVTEDSSSFVNGGRNRLRDGIIQESTISSFRMGFSTSDARVIRSDSSLSNVVDTQTPSVSTNGDTVTYSASTTATGVQTIGVFDDTDNDLLAIARLSDPVDAPTIDLSIDITNDPEETKTVWTDTGKTLIRDILAGNTPTWPQEYAYGSDATSPQESDTSLGNELIAQDLDEVLVKTLDTNDEWDTEVNRTLPDRLLIENSRIKLAQSGYFREAENADNQTSSTEITNTDFSNLEGLESGGSPNADTLVSFEFTAEHEIQGDDIVGSVRVTPLADDANPEFTFFYIVNGERFDFGTIPGDSLLTGIDWLVENVADSAAPDIGRGDAVEFGIEAFTTTSGSGEIEIDCLHMGDSRFSYTYDNSIGEFNELDGPELYPESAEFDIQPANLRRDATEVRVILSIDDDDASNGQRIGISVDGSNYQYQNNTLDASFTLAEASKEIYTRLRIDGYTPATRTSSPAERYESQRIDVLELLANPDTITKEGIGEASVRAIIRRDAAVGATFAEAGLVDSSDNLLTSGVVPEFEKQSGQLVISSERLRFEND